MARRPRRPRIIGPFFLVALLISIGIILWQRRQGEAVVKVPPMVEHQVISGATSGAHLGPPLDFVQAHGAELHLTEKQLKQLEPLVAEYKQRLAPLQRQMDAAVQQYQQYQHQKRPAKQVDVSEIQTEMAEISRLSGQMADLRRRYWDQMTGLLTPDQQRQAKALWVRSLQPTANQGARQP